jgi:predicted amidohydrolase
MRNKVKIAAVQMNPKILHNKKNLDAILRNTKIAARNGADLIVFPECALTGYMFSSRKEAMPNTETIPGPSTDILTACCKELGIYIIIGMLERDANKCFNVAVFIGPRGLIGNYRKNHLPFLGVDRFIDRGNKPFKVYKTPLGNIGLHICYDSHFPESARVMTLMGADILVLPTNWPEGREKVPLHVMNTRAYENKVHLVAVDRVGIERGTKFIGNSKIIDAFGNTLTQAGDNEEVTIYAEVNPADARQKQVMFKNSKAKTNFMHDRRPELYGRIAQIK